MGKKRLGRVLTTLTAATLISTCCLSGTFAKYTAEASGSDSARVAKWGITLTKEGGDSFAKTYKKSTGSDTSLETVVSSNDKVVAPGTSSDETDETLTYTLSGKPEVATRYTLSLSDVTVPTIPAGTVIPSTKVDGESFTTDKEYKPVGFYLVIGSADNPSQHEELGPFKDVNELYQGFQQTFGRSSMFKGTYTPASDIDSEKFEVSMDIAPDSIQFDGLQFSLKWAWQFDGEHDGFTADQIDALDSYLGNQAAADTSDDAIQLTYNFKASATQID